MKKALSSRGRRPAYLLTGLLCLSVIFALGQAPSAKVRNRDRKKDVEMTTTQGVILLRLSDQTPGHRDNFLRLVRTGYYSGIKFHRVIPGFMIQAGDPKTRDSLVTIRKPVADSPYTIPAEIRPDLFHVRGVLAAARMGDDVNPQRASSGTQFYIVQGRMFTDPALDSVETFRLKGRKIPAAHREAYKTQGGAPHLDQQYTVFGTVISGIEVVDRIAAMRTTGRSGGDRPLEEIRITQLRLIKRRP